MLYSESFFFVILPFLIYSCYTDIRIRKIRNSVILIILVLILFNALFFQWMPNFQGAAITFIVGIILFYIGGIGAGDIKLLTVLILSISNHYTIDFLLLVTLSGLPLILIIFFCYYILKFKTKTLPYGVAITAGYCLIYFFSLH